MTTNLNKLGNTNVFLDLEGTVIDSWGAARAMNHDKVRAFLKLMDGAKVHCFSFAVHNSRDKGVFDTQLRPWLERELGVQFVSCPSVQDQIDFHRSKGVFFDNVNDFINDMGKVNAFEAWVAGNFPGTNNVLVDDVVPNKSVVLHDSNTNIVFVNVDKLKG